MLKRIFARRANCTDAVCIEWHLTQLKHGCALVAAKVFSSFGYLILRWKGLLSLGIENIVVSSVSVAQACYERVKMLQSVGALTLFFHLRFELFSQFRIGLGVSAWPNTFGD